MPFNDNNYVADAGNGQYIVVVNGQRYGPFNDQSRAEQFYNDKTGASNTPTVDDAAIQQWARSGGFSYDDGKRFVAKYGRLPNSLAEFQAFVGSSGGIGAGGTGGVISPELQEFIDAATQGNADKFDWEKLNALRQQYGDLAVALIGTAANLRGPRDWGAYQQATGGGRNLMDQLFGSGARPDFSNPGTIEPFTISDLLGDLGLVPGGQQEQPGGTPTTDEALDYIWQSRPDLAQFYQANGWDVSTPEKQRAAASNWLGMTTDGDVRGANRDAVKYAIKKGWKAAAPAAAPAATTPATTPAPAATKPEVPAMGTTRQANVVAQADPLGQSMGTTVADMPQFTRSLLGAANPGIDAIPRPSFPATNGDFGAIPRPAWTPPNATTPPAATPPAPVDPYAGMLNRPYQINPANWDALSPSGQQNIIGQAEKAGWYADDWLKQLNDSRPKGYAPRVTRTSFAQPRGVY